MSPGKIETEYGTLHILDSSKKTGESIVSIPYYVDVGKKVTVIHHNPNIKILVTGTYDGFSYIVGDSSPEKTVKFENQENISGIIITALRKILANVGNFSDAVAEAGGDFEI